MQAATTVRFEQDTMEQLDKLAQSLGRPRSWVIKDAVARYLTYETWFRDEVKRGLDAIAAGDVVSHEEAKEEIRSLGVHID